MPNQYTKKPRKKYKHSDAFYAALGERWLTWYLKQQSREPEQPARTYRDLYVKTGTEK